MQVRTNQIFFIGIILCLSILACQFLSAPSSARPSENQGASIPLIEGITRLFGQTGSRINIGGIEPQGFEFIGQLGGSSVAVAARGDTVYLGQGPRVVALDISDPASPRLMAESPVLPGLVMGLALNGNTLYAVALYGGLHVLDISQPNVIKPAGTVTPNLPGCDAITIEGTTAYLACNPSGLVIVDIAQAAKPSIVFEAEKPEGASFSLALIDRRIYMVNTSVNELEIYDVQSVKAPKKVGSLPFSALPESGHSGGYIESVRVCGKYLCLAAGQDGLVILDLTDPEVPVIAGRLDTQTSSGLVVDGNRVYLADDMDGIHIINISDPSHPQEEGLLPTTVGGWELTVKEHGERGLYVEGDRLLITDPAYGLTVADIRQPASPSRLGYYMTPLSDVLGNIRVEGQTAYVTGRNSGFRIVDISEPEHPRELAYDDERKNLYLPYPTGLEVRGKYAYISDGNYPFHVVDVTDPAKPIQVGAVYDETASDGAFDIVLNGDLAYLSGWGLDDAFYPGKGLWVVDISNPARPSALQFVDVANERWHLAMGKGYLYALDGAVDDHDQPEPLSLRVFDLKNPQKPVEVKSIPLPQIKHLSPSGIYLDGDRLYISVPMSGVLTFDISRPDDPRQSGLIPVQVGMTDIYKDGSYLFLGGTTVYDISSPEKPGFAGTTGNLQAWDLAVEKDMVYVVTTFQGMYIYRFKPEK